MSDAKYNVVIDAIPNGITVGPFKRQHLAFEWGRKNVKRFGWHTAQAVSRAEAKRMLSA